MSNRIRIGVVVPAHNEEELLPSCLAALGVAARTVGVPVTVAVVLDSCTDGSLNAALDADSRPFRHLMPIVCDDHNVGSARARGAQFLLDSEGPAGLWLATTDADSVVPPHWLAAQLEHAAAGARAVVGTVQVLDWSAHPLRVRRHYLSRYTARPGHRHMHGANLSMAADAYTAAGGFPPSTVDEDVALVQRLVANDEPIVWAADLAVTTSARSGGRTAAGFAGHLRQLAAGPVAPTPPHAETVAE